MKHCLQDTDIQSIAASTHGFVGRDLVSLCGAAAYSCHLRSSAMQGRSCLAHRDSSREGEEQTLMVSFKDFEKAKVTVSPSALREVNLKVPTAKWEDIGGLEEVKRQLMDAVVGPQKHKDAFEHSGTGPPKGILMFGPPGCSKTRLAHAVASKAGLNFLTVNCPDLFSIWVGESEKTVGSLFAKASSNAPSIIFFDEIDGLADIRGKERDGVSVADQVMSRLLIELDGLRQRADVVVIAATNRPDKIDSVLLRPGRFDCLLYVGPPNEAEREDIFWIYLQKMVHGANISVRELASLTQGYTGRDILRVCEEATKAAIRENPNAQVITITMEHLKVGIQRVRPLELQSYQELATKFQRGFHPSRSFFRDLVKAAILVPLSALVAKVCFRLLH